MRALKTTSKRLCLFLNRHQLPFPSKGLHDISLLIQHEPICLLPYARQRPPPLEILRIALVSVRLLRVLPVALAKTQERSDLLAWNIIDERADRASF